MPTRARIYCCCVTEDVNHYCSIRNELDQSLAEQIEWRFESVPSSDTEEVWLLLLISRSYLEKCADALTYLPKLIEHYAHKRKVRIFPIFLESNFQQYLDYLLHIKMLPEHFIALPNSINRQEAYKVVTQQLIFALQKQQITALDWLNDHQENEDYGLDWLLKDFVEKGDQAEINDPFFPELSVEHKASFSTDDTVKNIDDKEEEPIASGIDSVVETLDTAMEKPVESLEESGVEDKDTLWQTVVDKLTTPPPTQADEVDCSVFAPASIPRGEMALVQVWAHLPTEKDSVIEDATSFDEEASIRGFRSLRKAVEIGDELTFHFINRKIPVEEAIQSIIWEGQSDYVAFELMIPKNYALKVLLAKVKILHNGLPAGHIHLKLKITTPTSEPQAIDLEPIGTAVKYRKAFVSYAKENLAMVKTCLQMLKKDEIVIIEDILMDADEAEIKKSIAQSDLFYLFWSQAASNSPKVQLHLDCLASLTKLATAPEIHPIPLESPLPVPPAPIDFQDFDAGLLHFLPPPPLPITRVLILAANPAESGQLRLDKELKTIRQELKSEAKYRDRFQLERRVAVTTKDLHDIIVNYQPDIVHFCGHGVIIDATTNKAVVDDATITTGRGADLAALMTKVYTEGGIVIEGENGALTIIDETALAELFALVPTIKGVILNCCYSQIQADSLLKQVPVVIGAPKAIPDENAIVYSRGFYNALGEGKDLEYAHQAGMNAIVLNGLQAGGGPVFNKV